MYSPETCGCAIELGTPGDDTQRWAVSVNHNRADVGFFLGNPKHIMPGWEPPTNNEGEWEYFVHADTRGEAFKLAVDHIEEAHPDRRVWQCWFVP